MSQLIDRNLNEIILQMRENFDDVRTALIEVATSRTPKVNWKNFRSTVFKFNRAASDGVFAIPDGSLSNDLYNLRDVCASFAACAQEFSLEALPEKTRAYFEEMANVADQRGANVSQMIVMRKRLPLVIKSISQNSGKARLPNPFSPPIKLNPRVG